MKDRLHLSREDIEEIVLEEQDLSRVGIAVMAGLSGNIVVMGLSNVFTGSHNWPHIQHGNSMVRPMQAIFIQSLAPLGGLSAAPNSCCHEKFALRHPRYDV